MFAEAVRRSLLFAGVLAAAFAVGGPVRAAGDPRAAVIELEWRTPTGFDRCAGVVTARRAGGLTAWTAGHCTDEPFTIVRFFDGYTLFGNNVRVVRRSDAEDAAMLALTLDPAHAAEIAPAVAASGAPPAGTLLRVIGHPVSALRGPQTGRWTVTFARMGELGQSEETGAPEYEISCSGCGPGNSGSGVFDAAGRLLGIVYGVTQMENVAGGRLPDGTYADVVPVTALR